MQQKTKILAIIPHYNVEHWLVQCIDSLCKQTHSIDQIVVVDDCSACPPLEILSQFPSVTLMKTRENGGPYKIHQALIQQTSCDYILFQDADDWSVPWRLECLLNELIHSEADMVGSQIESIYEFSSQEPLLSLTVDPFACLIENPLSHPILYSTAIISRNFFLGLGGFSDFRFGADSEFIRRAIYGGRVKNVPDKLYFRRIHPDSLTHHRDTGFGTPARLAIQHTVQNAARKLAEEWQNGTNLSLHPLVPGIPAELIHLGGPPLM